MLKFGFSTPICLITVTLAAPSARADAIRLQILGPDKKPLAGATVRVLEYNEYLPDAKPATLLDFSADAEGKIAFESKKPLVGLKASDPLEEPNLSIVNSVFARVLVPGMAVAAKSLQAGDNAITLQMGRSFGGVALDEDQKPVAGVKIALSGFVVADKTQSLHLPRTLELETTTDAAGKWSFEALPRAGHVQIRVNNPLFVHETLPFPLEAGAAPPLFLERGATIKGRLLKPDGSGAANVVLFPVSHRDSFSFEDQMHTDAEGRFEFSGLRAGDFFLQHMDFSRTEALPFLMESKAVRALKAGETRDLGAWKTQSGVLVKGKIVEGGTKSPIRGGSMAVYGMSYANTPSDKNGVFSLHAAEDAREGGVSAPGFISVQKSLPAAVNGVIDLGTIELKRGIEVKGTLKNKAGRAVSHVQVYAQSANGGRMGYGNTNDAGEFSIDALAAGTYNLKAEGQTLVAEVKFTTVAGQKTAPISGVVADEAPAAALKIVAGRALDAAGKPVAGAKIMLRFQRGMSSQQSRAISGIDGAFEVPMNFEGATPKVVAATRPGFVFARGGEFKIVDGAWRADLKFQTRGLTLRGRVVSAAGAPVARAFVSLAGRDNLPIVATDAQGAFLLPDAASEGVRLLISDGPNYGEVAPSTDGTVSLPPFDAPAVDAAALADQILPDAKLGYLYGDRWTQVWESLGEARLEAAIMRGKAGNTSWEWTWKEFLLQMSRRDPTQFLARADELMARGGQPDTQVSAKLALLRARSDQPAQRAQAQAWLDERGKKTLEMTAPSVTQLLDSALVAQALHAGDGASRIEFAAQIAAQLSDKTRADSAKSWGQTAAALGLPALDNLLIDWGANAKLNAYNGALTAFCEAENLASARAMLARMEAVLPDAQKAQGQVVVESWVTKPRDFVEQARGEVAELLAKTDPQAALELSKQTPDYREIELQLLIARSAIQLNQKPLAQRALRAVFETQIGNVEPGAEAAQIALGFDPKLADELFALAREKVKTPDDDFGYHPSIAAYAGARAKNWPGESRILIEREWSSRIAAYKPPEDNDFDDKTESLQALIGAMAQIAPRRALEMAAQLPEKGDGRAQARGKIALALLSAAK